MFTTIAVNHLFFISWKKKCAYTFRIWSNWHPVIHFLKSWSQSITPWQWYYKRDFSPLNCRFVALGCKLFNFSTQINLVLPLRKTSRRSITCLMQLPPSSSPKNLWRTSPVWNKNRSDDNKIKHLHRAYHARLHAKSGLGPAELDLCGGAERSALHALFSFFIFHFL